MLSLDISFLFATFDQNETETPCVTPGIAALALVSIACLSLTQADGGLGQRYKEKVSLHISRVY